MHAIATCVVVSNAFSFCVCKLINLGLDSFHPNLYIYTYLALILISPQPCIELVVQSSVWVQLYTMHGLPTALCSTSEH